MKIIETLKRAINNSAVYNPAVQNAPVCILWPDKDQQWKAIIPRLQAEMPELFAMGVYNPAERTGPAIWLRCVLSGGVKDYPIFPGVIPILYLPGVSRQELRAVEGCEESFRPFAELQYRGAFWSQQSTKDWTVLAFLKSDQGGLGLDVAQDQETKNGMVLALYKLLDEDTELLHGKHLDKDYFNTLLTGGDPVRDLLLWLDQGDAFKASRHDNEWKAFVGVCKSQLAFDPESEGVLAGAAKLAEHQGPWRGVWERYCEAPKRYLNIPTQIRKCIPPNTTMFWHTNDGQYVGWPQWNDDREKLLASELAVLASLPLSDARKKIIELESDHGSRRSLVWAELGEAPLAMALKYLRALTEATQNDLAAGKVEDVKVGYMTSGWTADDAMMKALACASDMFSYDVITTAIRAVYLPWAEASSRHFQKLVYADGYPVVSKNQASHMHYQDGECVLFVDGLRFDSAQRLKIELEKKNLLVSDAPNWSALPSMTATGKAAVTPVAAQICGPENSIDFEPCVCSTGQSLKGGHHLKKLLTDNGWTLLGHGDDGDGKGNAWCEFGDIDNEGHNRGWKLAIQMDVLLKEISDRVSGLLDAGWKQIRIVTDHGWILIPGGLPKSELPASVSESKSGRCAAIKPGAVVDERQYPWYWNPAQHFALADGISCYRAGEEYAHGGLSLQECLTLELVIRKDESANGGRTIDITDIVWRGLRCNVAMTGAYEDTKVDIRLQAGNPDSSIVMGVKPVKTDGRCSVAVLDESLEGKSATLVVITSQGELVAQKTTVIGGDV